MKKKSGLPARKQRIENGSCGEESNGGSAACLAGEAQKAAKAAS